MWQEVVFAEEDMHFGRGDVLVRRVIKDVVVKVVVSFVAEMLLAEMFPMGNMIPEELQLIGYRR